MLTTDTATTTAYCAPRRAKTARAPGDRPCLPGSPLLHTTWDRQPALGPIAGSIRPLRQSQSGILELGRSFHDSPAQRHYVAGLRKTATGLLLAHHCVAVLHIPVSCKVPPDRINPVPCGIDERFASKNFQSHLMADLLASGESLRGRPLSKAVRHNPAQPGTRRSQQQGSTHRKRPLESPPTAFPGIAPRAGLEPATNWLTANRSTC